MKTREDVGLAVALSKPLLGREMIYYIDFGITPDLEFLVDNLSEDYYWFREDPLTATQLLLLALRELREPHLCPRCQGRGHYLWERVVQNCRLCDGKGHVQLSENAKAELIGVTPRHWWREWRSRFATLTGKLDSAYGSAAAACNKLLKGL